MTTFGDLNLNVTNLPDKLIDQLVENAIKLGYNEVALSVDYEFPAAGPKTNEQKKKENRQLVLVPLPKNYKIQQKLASRLDLFCRKIKIYSRINVKIKPNDINTFLHHLKSKEVMAYDIIALEPVDSQVLLVNK